MSVVKTILGNYVDLRRPMEHDYPIEEIAWHLSKINRFTGGTRIDYSVARHSVYVSMLVPMVYAMEGLMHDASEAYLGDVSSPLKSLLPGYRRIEARVMKAIRYHHGMHPDEPDVVKARDKSAAAIENRHIMTPHIAVVDGGFFEVTPHGRPWRQTTAVEDCDKFLERYYELLAPRSTKEEYAWNLANFPEEYNDVL